MYKMVRQESILEFSNLSMSHRLSGCSRLQRCCFRALVPLLCLLLAGCTTRTNIENRILKFPEDHSLGTLWILENDPHFLSGPSEIEQGEARGKVTVAVPDGWSLTLRVSPSGSSDLAALSFLKPDDLQGISFFTTHLTDDGLRHLQPLTGLKFLDLSNTRITGSGFSHLKYLSELRVLDLTHSTVVDDQLAGLEPLSRLQSLILSKTKVGDAGLLSLRKLKELKELALYYTSVSDTGLKQIQQLDKLESLDLGFTKVTDIGLSHLTTLTRLRKLRFDSTTITDVGLRKLQSLSLLQSISLNDTTVTETGVREFARALPHCSIDANRLNMRNIFPSRYAH